jgi:hypothetical protein
MSKESPGGGVGVSPGTAAAAARRSGWRIAALAAAVCAVLATGTAVSQEGFPLKGSWLGTWESNKALGDDLILILDWDGKTISGMINPGTDNIPVKKASLDPDGWKVEIEADAKDKSGAVEHYVIEAHIENLELPNRSLVGTWHSDHGRGKFRQ